MAGRSKKSTKKFEKHHLKDTIERRKEFAKIKQRQQTKAKRKARNASDNARVSDDDDDKPPASKSSDKFASQQETLSKMSVDEFFQGGFDLPEKKGLPASTLNNKKLKHQLGKRKRETAQSSENVESDSSSLVEDQVIFSDGEPSSGEEEGPETHKDDLDALAEKDPEFYKYLQENDAELLDFNDDLNLSEVDKPSDGDEDTKKKRPKSKNSKASEVKSGLQESARSDTQEVTIDLLKKWNVALSEQHSLRAMHQVVLAFRAGVYINDDDGKEHKYSILNPDAYHQLLVIALKHIPTVLAHHLPAKESPSGKVRIATDSKKYRTLSPLLKSHSAAIHHLLENLSDAPTIKLTLSSLLPLLPYLLPFKKVIKSLIKTTVNIWSDSSSNEATRITAFLVIRPLALISDASLRESVFKTTYQGLVQGSRITNTHTIAGINLMKNSAAELWSLDPNIGYTTGFTYIRQLAVHLRTSITQPTKDSYKVIYNWQYTHSLDFWSRVLSSHCSPQQNPQLKTPSASPLHPLIYPLVQITLGALRLIPTPTYFPLRFHLTRTLLRLSLATNTYIPLAPSLLEVLTSPELSKPPKPSTLKPLDFNTTLHAPKAYLRTRVYQDSLGVEISSLLTEFFACWAKHIAFPELVIPPAVQLKRWLKSASSTPTRGKPATALGPTPTTKGKGNKNSKLNASIALIVQKLELNARWVEEHRRTVSFAPSDREGVENFLKDVRMEDTPLGAFLAGQRAQREERDKVLTEGRRAEEERGGGMGQKGKKGKLNKETRWGGTGDEGSIDSEASDEWVVRENS